MVVVDEHPFLLDRSLDLTPKEEDETGTAEGGIVMAELDLRLLATTFALHHAKSDFPNFAPA
jgi:hypothetical protein